MSARSKSKVDPSLPAEPQPRPKIQDVARAAGVSLGTVSAVLNGKGRVNEATKQRILEVISRLGYRPDLYASNLARKTSTVFGVIVSNLQNPFFAEVAQAMEEEAARHGYQISLETTTFSTERQRAAVDRLLGARVAGLAMLTSEFDPIARERIIQSGIPSVLLDVGRPEPNSVILAVDSSAGMRAATEHLIQLGHRDLLYIRNSQETGAQTLLSHKLRDQGFAAALAAHKSKGMRATTLNIAAPGAEAGELAIERAFKRIPFSGVVAVTDTIAMGVYRALHIRKLRIPADVSVVGFDDSYASQFLNPALTTVNIAREELSRTAVAALLSLRNGELIPRKIAIPTTLVIRSSGGPLNPKSRALHTYV